MIFSKSSKDDLYYDIREFFAEGGTLDDFFDVLHYFMEDFDLVERKD